MLKLEKRERQVFDLFAKGVSEHDASERLGLTLTELAAIWRGIEVKVDGFQPRTEPGLRALLQFERILRKRHEMELRAANARLNA